METPGHYKVSNGKVLVVRFRPRMRISPNLQRYFVESRDVGSPTVHQGRVTLRLLKWLALTGNGRAQFGLYLVYIKGYGVRENPRVARFWLLYAARNLYEPALRCLWYFFMFGHEKRGIPKDPVWSDRYLLVQRVVRKRERAPSSERRHLQDKLTKVAAMLPVVDGDTPLNEFPR